METFNAAASNRWIRPALIAAVIGFGLLGLGFVTAPVETFRSYLVACVWVTTISFGGLVTLMIVNAMGATWPVAVRRLLETIAGVLPLCGLLFLPILFVGLDKIYPWVHPESLDAATRILVQKRHGFQTANGFIGRSIFYFVFFGGVAVMLGRWSIKQDSTNDYAEAAALKYRIKAWSAGLLPPVGLAFTLAGVDWVMSITPGWTSTMFGVNVYAGAQVSIFALLAIVMMYAQSAGLPLKRSHYYAVGRLMFAFTVFWAYVTFFQFMLIWLPNRPNEVPFYLDRTNGFWLYETIFLMLGQFAFPFFALISYSVKQRPKFLSGMGLWILFMHYIDVHWLILPSLRKDMPVHWLDLAALLAAGGLAVAFGSWRLRGRALAPIKDPNYESALGYHSA